MVDIFLLRRTFAPPLDIYPENHRRRHLPPYLPTNLHLTQGRASFRGCWRGLRTPNDCKVEYFAPLRKVKTATPTVKCRNYLNCEALKCTKTTFPVAAPRTPVGEPTALLQTLLVGRGLSAPTQEPHTVPALSPSSLRLQPFGPRFTAPPG